MSTDTQASTPLAQRVAEATWYHTLELPGGIVTPGEYDLRPALAKVPLPERLDGMRCLDVGTRDGFWAFEMERRGAAEVVGIDIEDATRLDWPQPAPTFSDAIADDLDRRKRCFDIAREALQSQAERRWISVYDLDPDVVGRFDFAILGTMLLHTRDPIGALTAITRVLDGQLLLNEVISLSLTLLRRNAPAAALMTLSEPFWWIPNAAAVRRYVEAAGYRIDATGGPYRLHNGAGLPRPPLRSFRQAGNIRRHAMLRLGVPHVWVLATPRRDQPVQH